MKLMEDGKITEAALQNFSDRIGIKLRIPNIYNTVATKEAITRFVDGIGDEHELWRDEAYGKKSPYGELIAPSSFLASVFPAWVLQGLPGVHAIHASTSWEFYKPIYINDKLLPESYFTDFKEKKSKIAGQTIVEYQEAFYYNQLGELLAKASPVGYRMMRNESRKTIEDRNFDLPHPWTENELIEIERAISNEFIRGDEPLYWEDVNIGDKLPTLIKGPLGLTDMIAYCIGASPVSIKAHESSLKTYKKHPAWCFRDPYSYALEPIYSVHYNETAAERCGLPYPYDVGTQRHCWLIQMLTNWMGDYGWLSKCSAKYTGFVYFSDVVKISGRVTKKMSEGDRHWIVIKTNAVNQRGQEVMPGTAEIELPYNKSELSALKHRLRKGHLS